MRTRDMNHAVKWYVAHLHARVCFYDRLLQPASGQLLGGFGHRHGARRHSHSIRLLPRDVLILNFILVATVFPLGLDVLQRPL